MPMVYAEFRALRSVACCLLAMHGIGLWLRVAVCFLTMVAADAAQRRVVTLYHSVSQAHATALMVLGADAAFAPLLAIQLAAFLMTLVRKGLISTTTWHVAYTATLAVCVFTVSGGEFVWVGAVGVAFYVMRMWLGAPRSLADLADVSDTLVWLDEHAHVMRVGYALAVVALVSYGLLPLGMERLE